MNRGCSDRRAMLGQEMGLLCPVRRIRSSDSCSRAVIIGASHPKPHGHFKSDGAPSIPKFANGFAARWRRTSESEHDPSRKQVLNFWKKNPWDSRPRIAGWLTHGNRSPHLLRAHAAHTCIWIAGGLRGESGADLCVAVNRQDARGISRPYGKPSVRSGPLSFVRIGAVIDARSLASVELKYSW